MYCQKCGQVLEEGTAFCPNCGAPVAPQPQQPAYQQSGYQQPNIIINNNIPVGQPKDKWVAFLLCFFLGYVGAHKFYEGKTGMGILYLFTAGLFGIGVLVDWIVILTKPNPYYV